MSLMWKLETDKTINDKETLEIRQVDNLSVKKHDQTGLSVSKKSTQHYECHPTPSSTLRPSKSQP